MSEYFEGIEKAIVKCEDEGNRPRYEHHLLQQKIEYYLTKNNLEKARIYFNSLQSNKNFMEQFNDAYASNVKIKFYTKSKEYNKAKDIITSYFKVKADEINVNGLNSSLV